jgi:hypothetical protein
VDDHRTCVRFGRIAETVFPRPCHECSPSKVGFSFQVTRELGLMPISNSSAIHAAREAMNKYQSRVCIENFLSLLSLLTHFSILCT